MKTEPFARIEIDIVLDPLPTIGIIKADGSIVEIQRVIRNYGGDMYKFKEIPRPDAH